MVLPNRLIVSRTCASTSKEYNFQSRVKEMATVGNGEGPMNRSWTVELDLPSHNSLLQLPLTAPSHSTL